MFLPLGTVVAAGKFMIKYTFMQTVYRFAFSSGKGQMAYSWRTRRHTISIKVTTMLRLLYILGIIFAVVGVVTALRLFNIRTAEDFYQAQHGRKVSNEVSNMLFCSLLSQHHGRYPASALSSHILHAALSM